MPFPVACHHRRRAAHGRAPARETGGEGMSTFTTDTGRPVPSVTAAQMREIDRIAMEETGPNLFQMMENAGANLAALAMELLEEPAPVVALAGPGGNGGGGICAARHLANHGIGVLLCPSGTDPAPALAPPHRQKPPANHPQGTPAPQPREPP